MFLGINSKTTPLRNGSYESKSAYGWSSDNKTWLNGSCQLNNSKLPIEMRKDDKITLVFDCDNRNISMINERTKTKHELMMNTDHCPFPWQLHVILYEETSRVCILD
jgi:hypothetical protein